uniref:hypothetical protein n=1 Tax=Anaerococcus mediterraneensis TaxID=1870984 RepID=UPI0009306333|nr:hypothetical protein [Anaerococcus mediterraneensis]
MRIYEKYPEILSLNAKILDKRYKDNISQIILDKTILMPEDGFLLKDYKSLDGKEILNIKENKGKVIISIKGKISKENIEILVDKNLRYRNLAYNTAYILFQIFLDAFYGKHKTKLTLTEDTATISITDLHDDFDPKVIEEMMTYAIKKGLPIKNEAGLTTIDGLDSVVNSYINFDNTYKIWSFEITNIRSDGRNTIISFKAGQ